RLLLMEPHSTYCWKTDTYATSESFKLVCLLRLTLLFFLTNPATTETYTLSLHDALPISECQAPGTVMRPDMFGQIAGHAGWGGRSEEHTSELQSLAYLVCRLLLEKKKYFLLYSSYSCRRPPTLIPSRATILQLRWPATCS